MEKVYDATYRSPKHGEHETGTFVFTSNFKRGSKANLHDARVRMLEAFGSRAASWNIEEVPAHDRPGNAEAGQIGLGCREPESPKPRKRIQRVKA